MQAVRIKKLYDGTLSPPLEDAVVVFDGAEIADVFSARDRERLAHCPARIVDCSEYVMTPGLIDAHVHLMLPGDGTLGEELLRSRTSGEIQLIAWQNAMKGLRSGVTTMRDVGAAGDVALSVRRFLNNGDVLGPDILACGMPVTATGGHCWYMGGEADGPHEISKLIRRQQKQGIDFVKLMATSGGTLGVAPGETFHVEELQAAVRESRRLNLGITMHANRIDGLRKVVEVGPDGIEHCQFLDGGKVVRDSRLAAEICAKGIYPCHTMAVTVSLLSRLERKPRELWSDREKREREKQLPMLDLMPEQLAFQLGEGVPTVGGSDAGWRYTDFEDAMALSFEMMARAGMSARAIVHSATGLGAKCLGLSERLGTVEKGKQADLLLLSQDPEESISAFRKVRQVWKRGRPVLPPQCDGGDEVYEENGNDEGRYLSTQEGLR